jgi:putative glutathione S-transferase
MYVVAGCPFAARPWSVIGFYGLADKIPIVKCFPASYEDGWFFEPKSEGEHELVKNFPDALVDKDPQHGYHHLSELYYQASPEFKGAISVPLLWDTQADTAVSNSSLGIAEMIATQMRCMGTRNQDVLLFPSRLDSPQEYNEHQDLVKELHSTVTVAVYKINASQDGREHDRMVDEYYATLDKLEERLRQGGPYIMGNEIRFADLVLFISLVRLDLAYQWRFGLGRKSVRENYPILLAYKQNILSLPGIAETVLPRNIMALYFMTLKYVKTAGRTLPQVPETWENACCVSSKA